MMDVPNAGVLPHILPDQVHVVLGSCSVARPTRSTTPTGILATTTPAPDQDTINGQPQIGRQAARHSFHKHATMADTIPALQLLEYTTSASGSHTRTDGVQARLSSASRAEACLRRAPETPARARRSASFSVRSRKNQTSFTISQSDQERSRTQGPGRAQM